MIVHDHESSNTRGRTSNRASARLSLRDNAVPKGDRKTLLSDLQARATMLLVGISWSVRHGAVRQLHTGVAGVLTVLKWMAMNVMKRRRYSNGAGDMNSPINELI